MPPFDHCGWLAKTASIKNVVVTDTIRNGKSVALKLQ